MMNAHCKSKMVFVFKKHHFTYRCMKICCIFVTKKCCDKIRNKENNDYGRTI